MATSNRDKVEALRKLRRITQNELAGFLSIKQPTYSSKKNFSQEDLFVVATVLNVSPDVFGLLDNRKSEKAYLKIKNTIEKLAGEKIK